MTTEEFLTHPIVKLAAHGLMCAGAVQFFRGCFLSALKGVKDDLRALRLLRERDFIFEHAAIHYKASTAPKDLGTIPTIASVNILLNGSAIKEQNYALMCLCMDVAKFLEDYPQSAAIKYAEARCRVHLARRHP